MNRVRVNQDPSGQVEPESLELAELLSALSYALDITEGQPPGHCVRVCWIGMQIGRRIGLPDHALWELYYALLLKDLGCSSNAARICELYLTDDLNFKRDFKFVNRSLPKVLGFVFTHTGVQADLGARLRAVANIMRNGNAIAHELIETRCHRGAAIARRLRFSEAVAQGVQHLDEHWDGRGRPTGAAGEAISIYARIALLAQVIDVFHTAGDAGAAKQEAQARRGTWFDPALVDAFQDISRDPVFWSGLADPDLRTRIYDLEPAQHRVEVDETYLDDIAAAFGHVVDAKSPYTSGHSERVAEFADRLGDRLGLSAERRRWLRRAALLHDVGKLGVSNAVLDKPGRLDAAEWQAVQAHAMHTDAILSRISSFREMAQVSAAHHERLDGAGYPRALSAPDISLETRIITVADFFDALTADRPYRAALTADEALAIMRKSIGTALDPEVFAALEEMIEAETQANAA